MWFHNQESRTAPHTPRDENGSPCAAPSPEVPSSTLSFTGDALAPFPPPVAHPRVA